MNLLQKLLGRKLIEQDDDRYVWISMKAVMLFDDDGVLYVVESFKEEDGELVMYDINDVSAKVSDGYSFYEEAAL